MRETQIAMLLPDGGRFSLEERWLIDFIDQPLDRPLLAGICLDGGFAGGLIKPHQHYILTTAPPFRR